MKNLLGILLTGTALACSPIPELAAFQTAATDGGDNDAGLPDHGIHEPFGDMGFSSDMRRRGDMEFPGDMGAPPPTGPCPTVAGPAASFCYWPAGTGNANVAVALALVGTNVNCDLTSGRLSVNAAGETCAFSFTPATVAAWGFATTKPVHLAFSYSIKTAVDSANLMVNMPSGSMNEVLKVSGIYGSQNVTNLYSAAGVLFDPGFSVGLSSPAKKVTVAFDWISVWQ